MIPVPFLRAFGFLLILVSATRSELDSDAENRVFMRAQCKAMCLKLFKSPDNAAINKLAVANISSVFDGQRRRDSRQP
ncbi:hypothetical protein ACTXT7_000181 [Hymenolepis weldensis]